MATLNLDILKQEKVLDQEESSIIYKDLHLDIKQRYPLRSELEKKFQVNDIIADDMLFYFENGF